MCGGVNNDVRFMIFKQAGRRKGLPQVVLRRSWNKNSSASATAQFAHKMPTKKSCTPRYANLLFIHVHLDKCANLKHCDSPLATSEPPFQRRQRGSGRCGAW